MKSSSGNAAIVILLLLVAAFVIVAMHEKEFRGSSHVSIQNKDKTDNSPGIVESIINTFTGSKEEQSNTTTRARMKDDATQKKPATQKQLPAKSEQVNMTKQHDALSRRDRAELSDLLEKVNP